MAESKQWGVWAGTEVEGFHIGLETLFLYAPPEPQELVAVGATMHRYPHVYFALPWIAKRGWEDVRHALKGSPCVTVEVPWGARDVPEDLQGDKRIHWMVVIPVRAWPELAFFPDTGVELRLTAGEFYTIGLPYGKCWSTKPDDYSGDSLLCTAAEQGQKREA